MRVLVTGGAGFIGSALVRQLIAAGDIVLSFDKLTYAGSQSAPAGADATSYRLVRGPRSATFVRPRSCISQRRRMSTARSISRACSSRRTSSAPISCCSRPYRDRLTGGERSGFRFLHVSSDEVFGSSGGEGRFDESTRYDPRSPYAASKAASDHLVRAWGHTFGLPVLVTNCSNNYGPFAFPEKLIPLVIVRALGGADLPVYGDGCHVRYWLFVEDHAHVLEAAVPGSTYNVGGNAERRNIDVVRAICALLDRMTPRNDGRSYVKQIRHVADRPAHDRRYAIDATKIARELGWMPTVDFESGLERTVRWYLANRAWWMEIRERCDATARLGLAASREARTEVKESFSPAGRAPGSI